MSFPKRPAPWGTTWAGWKWTLLDAVLYAVVFWAGLELGFGMFVSFLLVLATCAGWLWLTMPSYEADLSGEE